MIILLDEQTRNSSQDGIIKGPATIFAGLNQRDAALAMIGIQTMFVFSDADNKDIRFESQKDYDYIVLQLPFFKDRMAPPPIIELYITSEFLLILGGSDIIKNLVKELGSFDNVSDSPVSVLSMLFGYILRQDNDLLEEIDGRIESLEERSTLRKPEDHSATIITLRKQLLSLKRYFEALYDLLGELEDNRNNLFSKNQLQLFRVHKNKANRLLNTVLNLRDYLTQVREAFQNQLDISLNDTMRFFTVITSIFLPLTLIVGWYGMNLHMPELAYKITYPIVIIVSLVFIAVSLVFCKKKGWF